MSEIKLLPCPFCGGEVETFKTQVGWLQGTNLYRWGAMCRTPKCFTIPASFQTEEEVIKALNTRKPMERILTRSEEAKFPQKIGGEVEMVVLKKRIDEIVKEEGGIE